jgi:hypothetical protein
LAQSTLEPFGRKGGSIGRMQWSVYDNDPRHSLTYRGIATAIGKRESACISRA